MGRQGKINVSRLWVAKPRAWSCFGGYWLLFIPMLLARLCSAQVTIVSPGGNGPLLCASAAVPRNLRSGGLTELLGDIVLTCTGGTPLAPGSAIPTANITVSFDTKVTNRIVGGENLTDALLLIDEPGSGLPAVVPGFGPGAPQIPCVAGQGLVSGAGPGGCTEYAGATAVPTAVSAPGGVSPGPNMFLGAVSENQIYFNGVPVLPPVGTTRVFRIANIRANVSSLRGPGAVPVNAHVSISGNNSVPVSNALLIAGLVRGALSTSVHTADNAADLTGGTPFPQCVSASMSPVAVLEFSELFGSAFQTRVRPTFTTNGQAAVPQNVPGQLPYSESGFVTSAFAGRITAGNLLGLADFGTRIKAVFDNISPGIHVFVSVSNLAGDTTSATVAQPPPGSALSFAQLVSAEAVADGNGTVPALNPTAALNGSPGITEVAEIPVVNGHAAAVWEVIETNPAALETLLFGVWISYSADPGPANPPPGTATVALSYAPAPGPLTFPAAAAGAASPTLPVTRFADTAGTGSGIFAIVGCQTLLLFPFVTNQAGFDTGIAIANTSQDPLGTSARAGSCSLNWYGGSTRPPTDTGLIAAGTVYTAAVSSLFPDPFTGYVVARCNFPFAHGFVFTGDLGNRSLSVEYLALIIAPNSQGNRNPTNLPESLLQ